MAGGGPWENCPGNIHRKDEKRRWGRGWRRAFRVVKADFSPQKRLMTQVVPQCLWTLNRFQGEREGDLKVSRIWMVSTTQLQVRRLKERLIQHVGARTLRRTILLHKEPAANDTSSINCSRRGQRRTELMVYTLPSFQYSVLTMVSTFLCAA